ncbi:MAG TPA: hypothetical protein VNT75_29455 [Symbiobacteriaceae bacterium]|nr:hypothetical protein [Symbiobacteriaceae bacterium]
MNEQQWYLAKLVIGTALMWLLFGWVLPRLGLSPDTVARALFMTIMVWGLWTLRKIANK